MAPNAGTGCTIGFKWFWTSVEAEEHALCFPAERNIPDPQYLAACQINRLRAIDNRGDNVGC